MPIVHGDCWPALFNALQGCDLGLRQAALQDVTILLHNNPRGAESLMSSGDWQDSLFSLLGDVKQELLKEEPSKSVHSFITNTLTLVHAEAFFRPDGIAFIDVLLHTLKRLHAYAGYNYESQSFAALMIATLCNKLASRSSGFSLDRKTHHWTNLMQLLELARRFVFQSAYWKTDESKSGASKGPKENQISIAEMRGKAPTASRQNNDKAAQDWMERQRGGVVLRRNRVTTKLGLNMVDEDTPILDYGLHYDAEGAPADTQLVKSLQALLRALHVDTKQEGDMADPTEAAVLQKLFYESQFWKDSATLLAVVHVRQVKEHKLYTFRKLSFALQKFVAHPTSDPKDERDSIVTMQTKHYMKSMSKG